MNFLISISVRFRTLPEGGIIDERNFLTVRRKVITMVRRAATLKLVEVAIKYRMKLLLLDSLFRRSYGLKLWQTDSFANISKKRKAKVRAKTRNHEKKITFLTFCWVIR